MLIARTSYRHTSTKRPKVAVVMVVDLPPDDPRLQAAMESLSVQTYTYFDVYGVDNREAGWSLGDARNRAMKEAHGAYVLFLDQLDMLVPDAIASMVDLMELNRKEHPELQHLTIGALVQNKDGERYLSEHRSPGIYVRRFVVDNPFPVDPMDFPDPYMRHVLGERSIHIGHHFGHVYREEPFRKDGFRS